MSLLTATNVNPAANYDCEPFSITTTSETTVLTALDNYGGGMLLTELWLADVDGTANWATVKLSRGGTEVSLSYRFVIAANTPVVLPFNGAILKKTADNTDTLKVTVESATVEGYVGYIGIRSSA